jgi:hypothetical protein
MTPTGAGDPGTPRRPGDLQNNYLDEVVEDKEIVALAGVEGTAGCTITRPR